MIKQDLQEWEKLAQRLARTVSPRTKDQAPVLG